MTFRYDINGIRALAVLSVVIYHFLPESLPGGFVGVDVFFVISGYLMTSIIITKLDFLFNYIEEDGVIGSTNLLENVTTFNFDNKNFITFKTRENREIDLTEYYDLIYEYKNDCLVAGIKYNKTYYKDRDLEPTEDFMLSIKLIPLTTFEQKIAN